MSKKFVTDFRGENTFTPSGRIKVKDEPVTPIEEDFGDHNYLDNSFENEYSSMKKSLSMNDIASLREDLMKLDFENDREEVYNRYRRPTGAPYELSKTKFVSMAEAIYHYQRDTPGRFHSTKPQVFRSQAPAPRCGLTIPQSPMLRSKARSRPIHVPTQKEKEEMEFEEIKKHKIKAHPIPKSVIEGPINLPEVPKKPITIPSPFNLTEPPKKPMPSPQPLKFKARPAPKHILEKPHIPAKPPVHVTKPVSPKFHFKRVSSAGNLRLHHKDESKPEEKHIERRQGPIKPEPFSFEKRDEELKRRRDEWIKRQIEEERKQASQFKAQPLSGAVKKRMHAVSASKSGSSAASENKENNHFKFEARQPFVLYKEPFKPVLQPANVPKQCPFQLTTEKRAVEREKFDQLLKQKEEEQERHRKLKEKELQEFEERAKAELRAKLVHHPVPVPSHQPFIPEKALAPITVPQTPKFIRRLKQQN